MDAIETIELEDGWTIEVHYDMDCGHCDPTDWDGRAQFALAHRRYDLRDDFGLDTDEYSGWAEIAEAIQERENPIVILPVYMMDHSGVSLSTGAYGCPWDSGQVGFVYVTLADIDRWGWTIDRPIEELEADLSGQVKAYGEWLNGEVYGYTILDPEGSIEGSCFGFVGSESIYDYAKREDGYMVKEARAEAQDYIQHAREQALADAEAALQSEADAMVPYLTTLGICS